MKRISAGNVVEVLTRALMKDQRAMDGLFQMKAGCNDVLARDQTIQVSEPRGGWYTLDMLGLINGMFGEGTVISAKYCEDTGVLTGFTEHKECE